MRHHIKEEENEMLPKAKEFEIDFEALGHKMLDRKKELKGDGIPKDDERSMVAQAMGRGIHQLPLSGRKTPSVKTAPRRERPNP